MKIVSIVITLLWILFAARLVGRVEQSFIKRQCLAGVCIYTIEQRK